MFTVIGILIPGIGWFLYLFLIPFWAMFPRVVVGSTGALYLLGTYLVGFPFVKLIVSRQPWYAKAKRDLKTKGRARIGGFTPNSGSSSWISGSSSDGGFSGGGGSSGGGAPPAVGDRQQVSRYTGRRSADLCPLGDSQTMRYVKNGGECRRWASHRSGRGSRGRPAPGRVDPPARPPRSPAATVA